jgi:hypothetical protein
MMSAFIRPAPISGPSTIIPTTSNMSQPPTPVGPVLASLVAELGWSATSTGDGRFGSVSTGLAGKAAPQFAQNFASETAWVPH